MGLQVHAATADLFGGVATLLRPKSEASGACWCLAMRLRSTDNYKLQGDDRPAHLRELMVRGPAPGVVAYLDGEPVGWCGVGPRTEFSRLVRSRTIPTVDDRPVWSVVCFVVRPAYRKRGLTRALLDGAVAHARRCGASAIEGYPVDAGGRRIHQAAAYVGMLATFEAAGFARVRKTSSVTDGAPRWLVRKELA